MLCTNHIPALGYSKRISSRDGEDTKEEGRMVDKRRRQGEPFYDENNSLYKYTAEELQFGSKFFCVKVYMM